MVEPQAPRPHWSLRYGPRFLIGAVFILCLSFGGRVAELPALLSLGIFVAALLFVRDLRRGKVEQDYCRSAYRLCGPVVGLIFVALLQLIPLPLSLLEVLSSSAAEIYREAGALWGTLSIHPRATLTEVVWLGVVLVIGLWGATYPYSETLVSLGLRRRARRRSRNSSYNEARKADKLTIFLQSSVIQLGAVLGLIGLIHWGLRAEALFGLFYYSGQGVEQTRLHWPFISPNHLSTLLGMSALLGFAHLSRLVQLRQMRTPLHNTGNPALLILQSPQEFGTLLPYAFALLIIVLANVLTLSRAGNLLMFLGLGLIWLTAIKHPVARPFRVAGRGKTAPLRAGALRVLRYLSGFAALAVFGLVLLGGAGREMAASRLEYGLAAGIDETRLLLAEAALDVFLRYPILGSGLGTWHLAAAREIPRELAGWELDYAHNEYLQLLAETGFAGGLIAILILYLLVQAGLRTWRRRLQATERVEFIGCATALALPLLHALVDFPFHLPAVAAVALIVLVIYLRVIERARRNEIQEMMPLQ